MDHDLELVYKSCRHCGLVFQSPRPSATALADFYKADYRKRISGSEGPIQKNHWAQQLRAEHAMNFATGWLTEVSHFLDIGSSLGLLVQAFIDRYDCFGCGIEPGEVYRERSIQSGIETYADLSDLPKSLMGKFQVISLMHVLEHIPSPVDYVSELVATWLHPHGFMLIEVPNLYAHPSYELAHQIAFSPTCLTAVLLKSGCLKRKVKVHGQPYSRLLPLFILGLYQQTEDREMVENPISKERGVRVKRFVGFARTRTARWLGRNLLSQKKLSPWDQDGGEYESNQE
jgi:SAM-dependent methyltransferase